MGRVIGLDVGERRIGIAISDPDRRLAVPLRIVERCDDEQDLRALIELAHAERVDTLVVGHPLTLAGDVGHQAKRIEAFAAKLAEASGLPVSLWDERLTSVQAERSPRGKKQAMKKRRRAPTDDLAASILLQTYLDRQRGSALPSA